MIHQFKQNGYNIVLDTASASVHSVDDVAYDVISLYEKKSADEIADELTKKYDGLTRQDVFDCLGDVEELKKEGKLLKLL